MYPFKEDLKALLNALIWYSKCKAVYFASKFELSKNTIVAVFMYRRGLMQKYFFHGSMLVLLSLAVTTSGVFGGQTLVSSAYPGIGGADPRFIDSYEPFPGGTVLENLTNTQTYISQKPRSEIVEYKVESGDTISSIAKKFNISIDTIKWANDITNENQIKPGQTIKILPVSGIAHTVKSGDSLQSIAKKYQAEAQAILDFPFNDIPDDFSLKVGQVLIVPDGVIEAAPVRKRTQPQYLAKGPQSPIFEALGGAKFVWPTSGQLTQYYAWYHPGIDLANRSAPGIAAADGGVVVVAGWPDNLGYGNRIVIDHGNGYTSMYAHLSNIYVSVGQTVSRGQVIGQMGSTGRSTGIHLHFEIHFKSIPVNPLSILQ